MALINLRRRAVSLYLATTLYFQQPSTDVHLISVVVDVQKNLYHSSFKWVCKDDKLTINNRQSDLMMKLQDWLSCLI